MTAAQHQDIMSHQSEECQRCKADGDLALATTQAVRENVSSTEGVKAEASRAPPARPGKEDSVSDLSTELGSDLDECSGDTEVPEVCMAAPFSLEETLFIFDWDDTLLPSTWVQQQGLRLDELSVLSDLQFAQLQRMADSARRTLHSAMLRGRVIIVTNGEQGWVELSCWKFMPSLAPMLEGIPVVSARSTYEKQGIVSPFEWKLHAFTQEIHGFYSDSAAKARRNVLSLGDSMHEQMALVTVTQGMANCRAKSLKFASSPELEQLLSQHDVVSERLDDIVDYDGDLLLEVMAGV